MAWPETVRKTDLKIDHYSGTGAGGQHRNKHQNCVRMLHKPTGLRSQCQDHKSREQNTRTAFRRLADKLVPLMKNKALRERYAAGLTRIRTYTADRHAVKDVRVPEKHFDYGDVLFGDGLQNVIVAVLVSDKEAPWKEQL